MLLNKFKLKTIFEFRILLDNLKAKNANFNLNFKVILKLKKGQAI